MAKMVVRVSAAVTANDENLRSTIFVFSRGGVAGGFRRARSLLAGAATAVNEAHINFASTLDRPTTY
jgi:hypothetical protein